MTIDKGMKVRIGGKHAYACSYKPAVNKEGMVTSIYERDNPYFLKGTHIMCMVDVPGSTDWEIHIEDCLPIYVPNKESKHVLARLDD